MKPVILSLICIVLHLHFVACQQVDQKRSMDPLKPMSIEKSLSELRTRILPKIPRDSYLFNVTKHDDLYLAKWLISSSMNVAKAADRLVSHFHWRKKENIDNLDSQDWSYFETDYVTVTGRKDKRGGTVAELWLSEWDVRKAILSGRQQKLTRWITVMVERQQRELYEARKAGRNVTHAVLLIDADGFNFVTHGCPRCLQVFTYWGLDWETHYPDLYDNVMIINVTPGFQVLITAMKASLRTTTMGAFHPIVDKRQWAAELDKMIDRSERSPKFGGTRETS